ncbi:MAG: endopeptidase [Solirubrobacteraceae bacterium]|nr:endopeptidase [Solirubrobacteraceae bacterium]
MKGPGVCTVGQRHAVLVAEVAGSARTRHAVSMQTARWTVPAAVAAALLAAEAAVVLLRPREGILEPVPVDASAYFTPAEIERGSAFRGPQRAIGLATLAVEGAALALLVARPPEALRGRRRRPVVASAAAGAALSAGLGAVAVPLQAVARRRAVDVGLVTQSWRGWAGDLAKSSAIGAVFAGAGAAAGVALMRRFPRSWWAPASGALVGFAVAGTQLGPVVLDPLFNRFTPLPEGETRSDVLELAERAGVDVGEVYEVDASRRTTGANAYVNGLGPTKRVVLYDTLLERFERDEVRLVVAHELAHVRHRDVAHGLLYLALVAPAAMLAAAETTRWLAPGGDGPEDAGPETLPALALSLTALGMATTVIANQLSRRIEERADAYALRLTGTTEPFIGFERRITIQNVGEPDPPAWHQALFGTHPTTAQRIGTALRFQRGGASGGD